MWSQACGKIAMLVHNVTLTKQCKKVKTLKTKKNLRVHFFSKQFLAHIRPLFHKSETTFLIQFVLKYLFVFY